MAEERRPMKLAGIEVHLDATVPPNEIQMAALVDGELHAVVLTGVAVPDPTPAPQDSPGPETGVLSRCEHCGLESGYDDEMRCWVCREYRKPHGLAKDSPSPELPEAESLYVVVTPGPNAQFIEIETAAGKGRRIADQAYHGVYRRLGPLVRKEDYEATVRSLITERDGFRDAWRRERREHITTAARGDERIEELVAAKEKAERERDEREEDRDKWLNRAIRAEKESQDLEAKLAHRPTITEEEIRAVRNVAVDRVWNTVNLSLLRTLADKLENAPAHDCTEHVRIEVTNAAEGAAADAILAEIKGGEWDHDSLSRTALETAIPHLTLVPKEAPDA